MKRPTIKLQKVHIPITKGSNRENIVLYIKWLEMEQVYKRDVSYLKQNGKCKVLRNQ